jgi:hypothetical protein
MISTLAAGVKGSDTISETYHSDFEVHTTVMISTLVINILRENRY